MTGKRTMEKYLLTWIFVLLAGLGTLGAQVRPDQLVFPTLRFTPPDPQAFQVSFAGGSHGYLMEDHSLPMVDLVAVIPYGTVCDPKDKAGLAQLLQMSLVKGGTSKRDGTALEERLDFLGATLGLRIDARTSTLSLSVLSKDLAEGLEIFFDLLRHPAFRPESIAIAKGRMIEELKRANDAPKPVLEREYARLLYGDHPLAWQPDRKTVDSLTATDLQRTVTRYFVPQGIVFAGAGDFRKAELVRLINQGLAGWQGSRPAPLALTATFSPVSPGVYFIQKKINQGYVNMGHLGIREDDPDYYAVMVMNFILGGGSFTSRITTKVRSDEGLAYNTGSKFTTSWGFPGLFAGYVQTKSSTVGYAISLIRQEFERIRNEPVSDGEMTTAINYFLESFPEQFTTPARTMTQFATFDALGRPLDYFKNYAAGIGKVDKARVQQVARKYIDPEKLAILVVGDWEGCNQGSGKYPHPLEDFGTVHHLELTDPMNP
ncbi:MAG TPA: pitrilysin family protein [Candidatus Aminicenantes bacterium]|nr:pitrilysin family protein [Candidatus Aminicenantes bacterium]